MSTNAGVWIDHRQAIIVFISEDGQKVTHIESGVEKNVRSAGGSESRSANSAQSSAPEDVIDRKFANHLNVYYKEVIQCLKDAHGILVMGPGEARTEFEKQIHSKEMQARVAASEKCDKMTEPQIIARVRDFFHATTVR